MAVREERDDDQFDHLIATAHRGAKARHQALGERGDGRERGAVEGVRRGLRGSHRVSVDHVEGRLSQRMENT